MTGGELHQDLFRFVAAAASQQERDIVEPRSGRQVRVARRIGKLLRREFDRSGTFVGNCEEQHQIG